MRFTVAIGLVLASCGCGGSRFEPRWSVVDHFPREFAASEQRRPPTIQVHSISLGFIGDQPIGIEPTAPHREPYWARPFPCRWTHTCWYRAPLYYAPYASVYAAPPIQGE
jgi:hypothetical protein